MIYTLGESLIDVIISPDGQAVVRPGGSQLNVAVSLGRSGNNVAMISETGQDQLGQMLTDFLEENRVATHLVQKYPEQKTSLALAFLDDQKKPSYSFYKMYPEKRSLKKPPVFVPGDILAFGSMYSRDPEIEEFLDEYIEQASRGEALIFYDPNVRHNHQIKQKKDREMLLRNLAVADVIKGSDEDFENIFGVDSVDKMKERVRELNKEVILIITLGEKGSVAYYKKEMEVRVPAKKVEVVSTIGAGDAFTAGMISSFIEQQLSPKTGKMNESHLKKMLREATRFSSMVCRSMDNYIPAAE